MRFSPPAFVRIVLAMLVGIFLSKTLWLGANLTFIFGFGLLFLFLAILFHLIKRPGLGKASGIAALLSILFFSWLLYGVNKTDRALSDQLCGKELLIKATITELGAKYQNGIVFDANIEYISDGQNVTRSKISKVKLYVKNAVNRNWLGKSLFFSTRWLGLSEVSNPYQFKYDEYLLSKGVIGQCFIEKSDVRVTEATHMGPMDKSMVFLDGLRWRGLQRFQESHILSSEAKSILSALCLGDRSAVNEEIESRFVDAGIIHILAVSGLHVGIIYLFLGFLLKRVLPKDHMMVFRVILILMALWCYAGVTGFSPSVLRASVMFSFILLGKERKRKANTFNSIAASAVFLLLLNPNLLFSVGFQLSYSAVIGIVAFYPLLNQLWLPPNKGLVYFWNLLCVSIVAQLATLPFALYYFHQFPTYFWLTNLVVLPLIPVLLSGGLIFIGISFVPLLNQITAFILDFLTRVIVTVVELVGDFPLAVIKPIFISHWQFSILLMAVLFILFYTQSAKRQYFLLALALFSVVPMISLFERVRSGRETEVVYYASTKHNRHISFRIGERVVVVGDTASSFPWKNHQLSNYCNRMYKIPLGIDTTIEELEFEKRGDVVYFGNRFYALSEKAERTFWYQVAPVKQAKSLSFARIKIESRRHLIIIF